MGKAINAVLIDAVEQTITDVEIEPTLKSYYKNLRCDLIQAVQTPWLDDYLYVDEEGLLKPITCGFSIGVDQYVGSGLVVGAPDARGGETGCTVKASEIVPHIRFFRQEAE